LTWSKYRQAFFEFLHRTQNSDGSWTGTAIGPVYTTSCYLTILQLDNGTLPIYCSLFTLSGENLPPGSSA
jgi:hypothetical protein